MKTTMLFLAFCVLMIHSGIARDPSKEGKLPKDERMKWWEEARFGMFIHWGIYSVPAGQYQGKTISNSAEWIMNKGRIPLCEYQNYSDLFNPVHFDAKAFVGLAKEAGMKYMVITSKHHDGFSMFGSKSNPFNVVDATPFKRDILRELAEECRKQGIRFGFYYSQAQDWSHPGGIGNNWDKKMQRVSTDVYVREKALPEVNQLLTEYGPIAIFWWDTPRQMSKEVVDSLYRITEILQPGIITNDRLGEGYPGDYKTFERGIPKVKPNDRYWEICQPISGSWGYKLVDTIFQTPSKLVRNLIDIASKGGNYLLNVSPRADGTLLPVAVGHLKAVGQWMHQNSESIYGTQAGPCPEPQWGRITMKTQNGTVMLYLHVFDWVKNGQLYVKLKNKAESCYLLTNPNRKFATKTGKRGMSVQLTGDAPDPISSVIVLKLAGMPNPMAPEKLLQQADGTIALPAERAQFQNPDGPGAEYQSNRNCVGKWTSETALVYWTFKVNIPGTFHMTAEVAGLANAAFNVSLAGQSVEVKIQASNDYNKFDPLAIGTFDVKKAGEYTITFKPVTGAWNPVNLRAVQLKPKK